MGFDQVSQNQHFPRLYQQPIRREGELVKGKESCLGKLFEVFNDALGNNNQFRLNNYLNICMYTHII